MRAFNLVNSMHIYIISCATDYTTPRENAMHRIQLINIFIIFDHILFDFVLSNVLNALTIKL